MILLAFSPNLFLTQKATSDILTQPTEYVILQGNTFIAISELPKPKVATLAYLHKEPDNIYKEPVLPQEEIIRCLIKCESGGNPYALNYYDTDGLPAYGILQFKERTFYRYSVLAGIKKPDIWNAEHQIITCRYMLNLGLLRQWGVCATRCR